MKHLPLATENSTSARHRRRLPIYLFVALCFNLAVATMVHAANSDALTRSQAWSLTLLGLATVALSIYLFFVIFLPEKF